MRTKLLLFVIELAVSLFASPVVFPAQIEVIPGSSTRGAELFRKKACVECHAFSGVGGNIAPDLAQPTARAHTPMQLASALWNHGPRMW